LFARAGARDGQTCPAGDRRQALNHSAIVSKIRISNKIRHIYRAIAARHPAFA
jgi:hypothetical protein